MKNKYLVLGLILLGTYASNAAAGEWLVAARAGVADIDAPSTDPAVVGYIMVGKEMWDIGAADIAIVGEAGLSIIDGEYANEDASFSSLGAYASLRTKGPVYVIGRAGVVRADLNTVNLPAAPPENLIEGTDTDISFGIGVGFGGAGLKWEILYTTYGTGNTDVDVLSLGLLF